MSFSPQSLQENPKFETKLISWSWRNIGLMAILIFLTAAVFNALNIHTSRKVGRLSAVATYDDVTYLNYASKCYFQARYGQRVEAVKNYFTSYTHAPLMVLLGILGFVVFGFSYYKVYYALTFVVFAYLGFVTLIGRRLPPFYLACFLLASLAIPFATMAALEFRPDQLWTIFLGGSCVWFLSHQRPFTSKWSAIFFGIGIGLALLSKPSTFAMTFIVGGGTWFLAACIAYISQGVRFVPLGLGFLLTLLAVFIISGWYFIPHAQQIFDYFYTNSFGVNRDIWLFRGGIGARMMYYISGNRLHSNLGLLFLPLLGLYTCGVFYDVFRSGKLENRLRGIAFLWMLGCLYLVNGWFSLKNPYVGGSFYGFLILGALWYLARLLRWCWILDQDKDYATGLRLKGLTGLSMMSIAWAGYQFPPVCTINKPLALANRTINTALVQNLLLKIRLGKVSIMFTQGGPVVAEFLEMEFRRRKVPIEIYNLATERRLETFIETSKKVKFVVLQDPDMQIKSGFPIPGEKLQPELLNYFRNDPTWTEAARYSVGDSKNVYLFERLANSSK